MRISDRMIQERRSVIISKMKEYLDEALKLDPDNNTAILNQKLLQWDIGEIYDEDVVEFLSKDFVKRDPHSAKLMEILFKRYVIGQGSCEMAMKELILKAYKSKNASNLSRNLLNNPFFMH